LYTKNIMPKKGISGKELDNAITSEDILGKEVIDKEGESIGVAERVFIDQTSLEFVGISIDKGFIKRGLTIGKSYIKKITKHAIFLKIKVAHQMKGMCVFDSAGEEIGTVSSIDLPNNKNKIKAIHVRINSFLRLFGKDLVIPAEEIKTIGDNIMLKEKREVLIKRYTIVLTVQKAISSQ